MKDSTLDGEIERGPVSAGLAPDMIFATQTTDIVYTNDWAGVEAELRDDLDCRPRMRTFQIACGRTVQSVAGSTIDALHACFRVTRASGGSGRRRC